MFLTIFDNRSLNSRCNSDDMFKCCLVFSLALNSIRYFATWVIAHWFVTLFLSNYHRAQSYKYEIIIIMIIY